MTTSMPSQEVYAIDAPEVKDLRAEFRYNFFVHDEGTVDTGGVTDEMLTVPAEDLNAGFVRFATTRVPRFVVLRWTIPGTNNSIVPRGTIRDNLAKIVSESDATSFGHFAMTLDDVDHVQKFIQVVSGTLLQSTSTGARAVAATDLVTQLPKHIDGESVIGALTQPTSAFEGRFFTEDGLKTTSSVRTPAPLTLVLNSKLADEMVKRNVFDPSSQYEEEFRELSTRISQVSDLARRRSLRGLSERDTQLNVVPVTVNATQMTLSSNDASVIGYVIDKVEHLPDGSVRQCEPIIIESSLVSETVDMRVRYGAIYSYTLRSIVMMKNFAIDASSGQPAMIGFLLSSKSSNRQIVQCVEMLAPPAPSDVQVLWNYEDDKLMLRWDIPVNPQRDIKGFQVFRRRTINDPFELIRAFDFNDATTKSPATVHVVEEGINASLSRRVNSAVSSFIDDDFTRRSSFIYAVCSIDAHGLTSGYSAQIQAQFDEFNNAVVMKRVSRSGAPKAYPNMYLSMDAFVDTMRTRGGNNRRLRLFLTPETYAVKQSDDRTNDIVMTKQNGSKYVLQIINLDRQIAKTVEVSLDDRTNRNAVSEPRKTPKLRTFWGMSFS